MHNRIVILSLFLFFALSAYSQTESKRDSIQLLKKDSLINTNIGKGVTSERDYITESFDIKEHIVTYEEHKYFLQTRGFKAPEVYVGPNPRIQASRSMPHINDYYFSDLTFINNDISYSKGSRQNTYIGLGKLRMVNASLNYHPAEWLTMSGGIYGAKYTIGDANHYNDLGFNASIRVDVHDRIYLRAHGMYSINSNDKNRNFTPAMTGLFPQTYYGGGAGFKVTDKFGFEGGVIRELNPMTGKWKTTPYIFPVFHLFGK